MKPSIIKYCLLISVLLSSAPLQAAWYQVEVILFEYLEPDVDGELWYDNPGLPATDDAVELISESAARLRKSVENKSPENGSGLVPYRILSSKKYRLRNDYRAFKQSKDYRALLHIAWQQPGGESIVEKAVHIRKIRANKIGDEGQDPARLKPGNDEHIPSQWLIDGTVRVRSTKYLHVDVDFAFFSELLIQMQQPMAENTGALEHQRGNSEQENRIFVDQHADYVRLRESRKIKLNELHYFDHPLFGVLIQVSRIESDLP